MAPKKCTPHFLFLWCVWCCKLKALALDFTTCRDTGNMFCPCRQIYHNTTNSPLYLISSSTVVLCIMKDYSSLIIISFYFSISHIISPLMLLLQLKSLKWTILLTSCIFALADASKPFLGPCLITHGNQVIDKGYPGALSRYTLDFFLLYSFLPALLLLGIISYKIRDRLVQR